MAKKNKRRFLLISIISISIILMVILGLVFLLPSSQSAAFSAERNGFLAQAFIYDINGKAINPSTFVSQTTVTPQDKSATAGIFFMTFRIFGTNEGNVVLNNFQILESHPTILSQALQGSSLSQSSLAVGESNVLLWNTEDSCTSDTNCDTGEKCNGDPVKTCKMIVDNLIGNIVFGATIQADWTDAINTPHTTSTIVNLPILFEQDNVIFRTNAVGGDYTASGNQVAVDRSEDGTLEAFTRVGSGLEATYLPSNFLSFTVQGNLVFKCFSDRVCVSRVTGLPSDVSMSNVHRDYYDPSGSLSTVNTPVEPYTSSNCNGNTPCQEVYSISVSPPQNDCGNNIIEGTELCDGTDLGDDDCVTINQGFVDGTLACSSSCNSWDTTSCNLGGGGPTENVMFRTFDLAYADDNAVAYSTACDGLTLEDSRYGRTSGICTDHTCDDVDHDLDVKSFSGTTKLWVRDAENLCICEDGATSGYSKRYNIEDTHNVKVNPSGTSIDDAFEVACP